jgi:hypothetical protein
VGLFGGKSEVVLGLLYFGGIDFDHEWTGMFTNEGTVVVEIGSLHGLS